MNNAMERINRSKVPDTVIENLKNYIVKNNMNTGDKLPSETVLCETLGISRPSIREAFKTLEGGGFIETKHGKGRYLKDFNFDQLIENLTYNLHVHYKDFREVVQVRMALEAYFLPQAIGKLTDNDFSELEALLKELEAKINAGRPDAELVETHTLFHRRLYQVFDNKLLDSLISMFASFQRILSILNYVKTSDNVVFLQRHWEILESLRSGDKKRIAHCFDEHFSDYEHLHALNIKNKEER